MPNPRALRHANRVFRQAVCKRGRILAMAYQPQIDPVGVESHDFWELSQLVGGLCRAKGARCEPGKQFSRVFWKGLQYGGGHAAHWMRQLRQSPQRPFCQAISIVSAEQFVAAVAR